MRTTVDLPDDLYRSLKARAALSGVPVKRLVQQFIEQGLGGRRPKERREPPPVIIPPRGVAIPAVSRAAIRRIEAEEDEAKHARSSGR